MLLHQLLADGSHDVHVGCYGVEVEQWDAELVGGGNGDIACGGQVGRNQVGNQADALFLRFANRVLHGGFIQQSILDQSLREPTQGHLVGASDCRYCIIIHGVTGDPGILDTASLQPAMMASIVKFPEDGRTL